MTEYTERLRVFLNDPLVGVDNKGTQRALRGIVLGRKKPAAQSAVRTKTVASLGGEFLPSKIPSEVLSQLASAHKRLGVGDNR